MYYGFLFVLSLLSYYLILGYILGRGGRYPLILGIKTFYSNRGMGRGGRYPRRTSTV